MSEHPYSADAGGDDAQLCDAQRRDALSRLLDGDVDGADLERLRDWFRAEPLAIGQYLEQVELHALLSWQGNGAATSPLTMSADVPVTIPPAMALAEPLPLDSSPPGVVTDTTSGSSSWLRSPLSGLLFAMLLLGLTFWLGVRWQQSLDRVAPTKDAVTADPAFRPAASLARLSECRWSLDDEAPREGAPLASGDHIDLAEGLAEVRFDDGVTVFLRGPASLVVESPRSARLKSGTMSAIVPPGTTDFEIRTPVFTALNSGAETSLAARPDGTTEIQVARGYVSVARSRTTNGETPRVVLLPGEALRIEPDGDTRQWRAQASSVDSQGNPIVDSRPTEYRRAVLADRPVMYWSFDEPGPFDAAIEAVEQTADRRLHPLGEARRVSHASLGSGLALGNAADLSGEGDCFISQIKPKRLKGAWAIEMWLQITRSGPGYTKQYVFHTNPSAPNSTNPSLIFDFDDGVDNEVELLSKFNGRQRTRSDGGPVVHDDQWHHLLCVFRANVSVEGDLDHATTLRPRHKLDIYWDGRRLPNVDCGDFDADFAIDTLLVGASRPNGMNGFIGRLDEFAVYDLVAVPSADVEKQMADLARRHIEIARQPFDPSLPTKTAAVFP